MKKHILAWLLLLVLLLPITGFSQANAVGASATLQSAATATGNGSTLSTERWGACRVKVTISVTATVTFEVAADGTNFAATSNAFNITDPATAVSTATATGTFIVVTNGAPFRARISSYGSGTVTVVARQIYVTVAKAVSGGGLTVGTTTITGGTNTRMLFNDSGVVGEDAGFTYVKGTDTGTIGNLVVSTNFTIGGGSAITSSGAGGTVAVLGANTFTAKQTITQASANAGILASTGYSLTGSDTTPMIDLAGTWNTSGTPNALKINITNTASSTGLLANFQVGSSTLWSLDTTGKHRQINGGSATVKMVEVRGDGAGGVYYEFSRAGGGFLSFGVEPAAGGVIAPATLPNASVIRTYDPSNLQVVANDTTSFTVFYATANIGIGSTTDTGQKLQVTGLTKFSGHTLAAGTAPAITSGFGTDPAIAGADEAGRVTVGTGGTAQTGVVTFGTAYTVAPSCVGNNETTTLLLRLTASTTTLTFNSASAWTAGDTLTWRCTGY